MCGRIDTNFYALSKTAVLKLDGMIQEINFVHHSEQFPLLFRIGQTEKIKPESLFGVCFPSRIHFSLVGRPPYDVQRQVISAISGKADGASSKERHTAHYTAGALRNCSQGGRRNQKKHDVQCLTRPLGGDVESSHMIMLTRRNLGFFFSVWMVSEPHAWHSIQDSGLGVWGLLLVLTAVQIF